jgi:hypothetical protein
VKRFAQLAGERLVGLVLPKIDAGACVPEHGQCCKKGYRFNCNGICSSKSSTCK